MDITIYKTNGCGFCVKIDQVMSRAGLEYKSIFVGQDLTRDEFKLKFPGASGFPYVIIDGNIIGGVTETVKYFLENNILSSKKNE